MTTKRKTVRVQSLGEWKPSRMNGDTPKVEVTIPASLRKPEPEPNNGPHMLGLSLIALALFAFGLVIGLALGKLL